MGRDRGVARSKSDQRAADTWRGIDCVGSVLGRRRATPLSSDPPAWLWKSPLSASAATQGTVGRGIPTEDGSGERVIIRLTDGEQREVFHRFCVDVVEATRGARSADEAIERFLARTWRWHRLLRSGQDGRLSEDEQKGLIGELRVIERCLLGVIEARDAVDGWAGPLGAPKDFQFGLVGVEAKARSPQRAEVRISSAHQLDSAGTDRLFLSVIEVAAALDESATALTITDVAARVRNRIAALDMSATIVFEERLAATGFDWDENYSDKHWSIGDEVLYEVADGFPRITPSMVPAAVDGVRYSISLAGCAGFRIPQTTLAEAISGEPDGP